MFPRRDPLQPGGLLTAGPAGAEDDDTSAAAVRAILRDAALYKHRATEHGVTAYLGRATAGERVVPDRRFLRNVITHTLAHNRTTGEASSPPRRARERKERRRSDGDDEASPDGSRKRKSRRDRSRERRRRSHGDGSSDGEKKRRRRREREEKRRSADLASRKVQHQIGEQEEHKANKKTLEGATQAGRVVGPTRATAFGGKQVRGRGKRKFLKRLREMEMECEAVGDGEELGQMIETVSDRNSEMNMARYIGQEEAFIQRSKQDEERSITSSPVSSDSESEEEKERKRRKKRRKKEKRKKRKTSKKSKKKKRSKRSSSSSSSDD